MSASETFTLLLVMEAIDKAQSVLEGWSGKLDELGAASKAAGDAAKLSAEELANAQVVAEASANAAAAAMETQTKAQVALKESTDALNSSKAEAQAINASLTEAEAALGAATEEAAAEAQAAYDVFAKQASLAADAVSAASAKQIEALEALKTAQREAATAAAENATAQQTVAKATEEESTGFMSSMAGMQKTALVAAAAVAAIGYESVKSAANFQSATTVLVTSGGETAQNIGMVRQGILDLASSTGTATQELVNGMYMIGSAGFTGAKGLTVLKAAAQGAKAENADLGTVSNALTTILTDYGLGADKATASMNQLITVVQNGKTTTEALAASLSTVLPVASAAGLGFDQIGGAMATMTAQGMSADQAAQDIAFSIRSLQAPSSIAVNAMTAIGLNSVTLSKNLGKEGLTGTMDEIYTAIMQHMGPSGLVLQNTFNQSAAASSSLNAMLKAMPGPLQALATQLENGGISAADYQKAIKAMSSSSDSMGKQFASLLSTSQGFTNALKSGKGASLTFSNELNALMGGATGLNTALMLTGGTSGSGLAVFDANVKKVGASAQSTSGDVNGWAEIQGTFNQKLSEFKGTIDAAAISLGTALLPMVTKLMSAVSAVLTPVASWISRNKDLAAIIIAVVGAVSTFILVINLCKKAVEAWNAVMLLIEETNPIILAITAIALVALLIIANWSTVKRWLSDFWDWLKQIFDDGMNFFKKWWPELLAVATFGMSLVVKLIMDHWNQIMSFLKGVWNDIVGAWNVVSGALVGAIEKTWSVITGALATAWNFLAGLWNSTGGKLVTGIAHAWDSVSAAFSKEWTKISGDLSSIWQSLVTIWNATGGKLVSLIYSNWGSIANFFEDIWNDVAGFFGDVWGIIEDIFSVAWAVIKGIFSAAWSFIVGAARIDMAILSGVFKAAWSLIEGIFSLTWNIIVGIVKAAWAFISGEVMGGLDFIEGIFQAGWAIIKGIVEVVWGVITTTINIALDLIKGIFQAFADIFTGNWTGLWNDMKNTLSSVWHDITGFFSSTLKEIETAVSTAASSIWHGFIGAISSAISGIGSALTDVWNTITGFFSGAGHWLEQIGKNIIEGLVNGFKDAYNDVKGALSYLTSWIPSWKGPPATDATLLSDNGSLIMQGLISGIESQKGNLVNSLGSVTKMFSSPALSAQFASAGGQLGAAVSRGAGGPGGGGTTVAVNMDFGNSNFMGPQSQQYLMQMINQAFVQKILPQAGVTIRRPTT